MPVYVCPAAVVAAPCAKVWEVLGNLPADSHWIDAQVQRAEPPGLLQAGQTLSLTARGLGRQWPVTIYVDGIDEPGLAITLWVTLPFGIVNRERISCTPISENACRVQFG